MPEAGETWEVIIPFASRESAQAAANEQLERMGYGCYVERCTHEQHPADDDEALGAFDGAAGHG